MPSVSDKNSVDFAIMVKRQQGAANGGVQDTVAIEKSDGKYSLTRHLSQFIKNM
jgi:hypothetical protein